MSKSYTPPDKSTYDPGWNDPPAMMTGQAATKTAKSRLSLNKRVAFPMQNAASPSTTPNMKTADSGLPLPYSTAKYNPVALSPASSVPTPQPPPPPISSIRPPNASSPPTGTLLAQPPIQSSPNAASHSDKPSNVREFCYRAFSNVLKLSTAPLDTTKTIEIDKRLGILNNMWLNEEFNGDIEDQLFRIAQALAQNNVPLALEQHRLLIVNHTASCNQWGTALRQLILLNEMEDSATPSTAAEDEAVPALLDSTDASANIVAEQIDVNAFYDQKRVGTTRFGPIQHL